MYNDTILFKGQQNLKMEKYTFCLQSPTNFMMKLKFALSLKYSRFVKFDR